MILIWICEKHTINISCQAVLPFTNLLLLLLFKYGTIDVRTLKNQGDGVAKLGTSGFSSFITEGC